VLIVCRGGGSIEDLWAFNEEVVAHAVRACAVPVVTGIGHETDFTIADFVADARAPTPTAAAELVSPSRTELAKLLRNSGQRLLRVARRALEERMQRLDYLSRRLVHPGETIRNRLAELRHLAIRLREGARRRLEAARESSSRLAAHLKHLNPRLVLERGYSITEGADGRIVRDAAPLAAGDEVKITFARGWAGAVVKRKG
jgi:exodeoxyribonuclease VII large subunit